jgi:hypothetical protein
MNDGTILATLVPANFALSGFIAAEGATVTQTVGNYDSPAVGSRTVTANLGAQYFAPNAGTRLTNYILPASATGDGAITPAIFVNAPTLSQAIAANLAVRNLASSGDILTTTLRAVFAAAVPRAYIPYPAPSALSSWQNNGFGSLPAIIDATRTTSIQLDSGDGSIQSGLPVINSTEQVLLQGGKNKAWRIVLPPPDATSGFTGGTR